MIIRSRLILHIFGCVLFLACSQKTPAPVQPESVPKPIPLGEHGSHALFFKNVSYRIPTGTILGEVRVGRDVIDEMRWTVARSRALDFNVSVTDGLRDLGYEMRDSADALFDPTGEVKIRYVMAAVLHTVELDFEYEKTRRRRNTTGVGTADVEVEVQLFDAVANRTVYRRTFYGHGEDAGMKPNPIINAVVEAILKSTTDPAFVKLVSKRPDPAEGSITSISKLDLAACQRDESTVLPLDLPTALESVVEIQVGRVLGTGVIISPDGWILTAAHVVNDAPEIWVRFRNGAQVLAALERSDARFDVALIRVQGRSYPCSPIRLATEDLAIGSDVFTINLALGDDSKPAVARGVVSGFPELEGKRFIQTDASVNAGSSGGPVFAPDSSIAGITVLKAYGIGVEGIGFAVPIDDVIRYLSVGFSED